MSTSQKSIYMNRQCCKPVQNKAKGKAIPVHAYQKPTAFQDNRHMKVAPAAFTPPGNIPGDHLLEVKSTSEP
jgi:hypothetical protein